MRVDQATAYARRDEARARARAAGFKRRCDRARGDAQRAARLARLAVDKAYQAARGIDDAVPDDAVPVEIDTEVKGAEAAAKRCEGACRHAVVAATRVDPRSAERMAGLALKAAEEAGDHAARVAQLVREVEDR